MDHCVWKTKTADVAAVGAEQMHELIGRAQGVQSVGYPAYLAERIEFAGAIPLTANPSDVPTRAIEHFDGTFVRLRYIDRAIAANRNRADARKSEVWIVHRPNP